MKLSIAKEESVELEEISSTDGVGRYGREFNINIGEDSSRLNELINNAARSHFEMPYSERTSDRDLRQMTLADKVQPAMFREQHSKLLRMVYKELAIKFQSSAKPSIRKKILEKYNLSVRRKSRFSPRQLIVHDPKRNLLAHKIIEVSNELMMLEEVEAVSPNFVSEFPRDAPPTPASAQWHLHHGSGQGHDPESDIEIRDAWKITLGSPQSVVAVLDDGVDIDHPNLRDNILSRPDPDDPRDQFGRDFYISDDEHPEHFNPRPKLFRYPYDEMRGNDIHGTPCAGVAASSGRLDKIFGAAPACKILPVKVFHADELASESRVSEAIFYAARFADVVSCSWSGPRSPIIDVALRSAASGSESFRRGERGTPVFFAAGNESRNSVSYPAASDHAIAVAATTDAAQIAGYSNQGPEIWISAPSSGGSRGITATDVSYPNRGFNTGSHYQGGIDGLHTNSFGGTSSATPLVAGIAALMISVRPDLTLDQIKSALRDTADKIGSGYSGNPPHSNAFGYGRANAGNSLQAVIEMPIA
ncbi:MAG: S8 family serine peptidase [Pseudomonadota bacterium]